MWRRLFWLFLLPIRIVLVLVGFCVPAILWVVTGDSSLDDYLDDLFDSEGYDVLFCWPLLEGGEVNADEQFVREQPAEAALEGDIWPDGLPNPTLKTMRDSEAAMNTPRRRIGDLLVDVHAGDREPYSSVIEEICAIAREASYTREQIEKALQYESTLDCPNGYLLFVRHCSLAEKSQFIERILYRLTEPKGEHLG